MKLLIETEQPTFQTWYLRHPTIIATLVLSLFNALLTLLLFGVVAAQSGSLDTLGRFWDGPEYLTIAHSLYDPNDALLQVPILAGKSPTYWAAHFPLYPFIIRLLAVPLGYLPAMFISNFLLATAFAVVLYRLLADFNYSRYPLWLAAVSLFLPLRWLIYHSVGASEATMLFFLVLSFYLFKREYYWWAGLAGAGAVLSRPNGIFLYVGLGLCLAWQAWQRSGQSSLSSWPARLSRIWQRFNWRAWWALSPMPLALLAVFSLYWWRYGDFLAYLHIPESVTHIFVIPLLSLNIEFGRSEGSFYYYLLEVAGLVLLWRRHQQDVFWVGLALVLPTFFLLHDDILRYSLPGFPFVLLIPFATALESKPARWLAPLALFGVLVYSWSQLNLNLIDLDNWQALLKGLNR